MRRVALVILLITQHVKLQQNLLPFITYCYQLLPTIAYMCYSNCLLQHARLIECIRLSVYLSVYMCVSLSVCQTVSRYICLYVRHMNCQNVYQLSVELSTCMSISLVPLAVCPNTAAYSPVGA